MGAFVGGLVVSGVGTSIKFLIGCSIGSTVGALVATKVRNGVDGVGEKVIVGLDVGMDIGLGVGFNFCTLVVLGARVAVREVKWAAHGDAVELTFGYEDDDNKFVSETVGLDEV